MLNSQISPRGANLVLYKQTNWVNFLSIKETKKKKERECVTFIFDPLVKLLNSKRGMLYYRIHCSCFISFPWVHTSLIMFHFYFLQSTVHLIHFTYHSPSRSCLPYLVVFILHGHSTSLSVSLSSQSRLWKLTTYECL